MNAIISDTIKLFDEEIGNVLPGSAIPSEYWDSVKRWSNVALHKAIMRALLLDLEVENRKINELLSKEDK